MIGAVGKISDLQPHYSAVILNIICVTIFSDKANSVFHPSKFDKWEPVICW